MIGKTGNQTAQWRAASPPPVLRTFGMMADSRRSENSRRRMVQITQ